jgi:hypothetical protein
MGTTPEIIRPSDASAGYFVEIDDNAMLLTVRYLAADLKRAGWRAFVRACHQTAGNLGFGIEFIEKR